MLQSDTSCDWLFSLSRRRTVNFQSFVGWPNSIGGSSFPPLRRDPLQTYGDMDCLPSVLFSRRIGRLKSFVFSYLRPPVASPEDSVVLAAVEHPSPVEVPPLLAPPILSFTLSVAQTPSLRRASNYFWFSFTTGIP